MLRAIIMPPSMSCAVSFRLAEKGLAAMMMTAINTNNPLPIYDAFILCVIFMTSVDYFFDAPNKTIECRHRKIKLRLPFGWLLFI
jgi:hypothetical protein